MKVFRFLIIVLSFILFSTSGSQAGIFNSRENNQITKDTAAYVSPYSDDNERCFKCHGQARFEYTNENLGRQVKALMYSERRVDRDKFYKSNHRSFSCTDCHSEEYTNFPHSGELRMGQSFSCLDCHAGDEAFALYHFEEIDAEYQESTHYKLEEDGFSCWGCHNPHTYKISIRNTENLRETIQYDNSICLSCHSNFDHFQLLTEREEINILKTHSWLPNQASHFRSVRCIECHTKANDSILVAHLIRPKSEAVHLCNECHSQNSILMTTLYKFESKEQRKSGFFNGIILNESYVIGANRNEYLNLLSLLMFLGLLFVIGVHILFRIRKSNNTI